MTKEKNGWQPPNWKDESLYPDPKTATLQQWVWEFLRRNLEYQQLFEEWYSITVPDLEVLKRIRKGEKILPKRRSAAAIKMLEHRLEELRKMFKDNFGILVQPPNPNDKFEIVRMSNPPFRLDQHYIKVLQPHGPESKTPFIQYSPKEGEIAIIFDIKKSIPEYLESVGSYLRHRQKDANLYPEPFRNRVKHYPRYLRLLDAASKDATQDEIAEFFYPETENEHPEFKARHKVGDDLDRAKYLRDEGYRFINDSRVK